MFYKEISIVSPDFQEQSYILLQNCVDMLENAASSFAECISKPIYDSEPIPHYLFKDPDQKTYVVLRCVRIASGFNASLKLLKYGYAQEVGVILRSILEFIHDMDFVFEGFINKDSEEKIQSMIDTYFSEKYKNTRQLLEETKKQSSIPRKKIYASIGRMYGRDNPHRYRQIAKALEEGYSGYVHGGYHQTMEMWDQKRMCYEMKGQPYRIMQWLNYMSLIVHPALNIFSAVSHGFGLNQHMIELDKKRIELESSPVYNWK